VLGVGGDLERGAEEDLDDRARPQRRAPCLGLEAIERGQARVIQSGEAAAEDLLDQRVLAAEMVIDRRKVGAGRARDHPHRGRVEAVFDEQRLGRIEDAVAGVAGRGARGGFGHRCGLRSNERLNHRVQGRRVKRSTLSWPITLGAIRLNQRRLYVPKGRIWCYKQISRISHASVPLTFGAIALPRHSV